MKRKNKMFSLSIETIRKIEQLAKKKKMKFSAIVEDAIERYS